MIHRVNAASEVLEKMPRHLAPMLAVAGELPARDGEWAYEFKWDGVRAIVFVERGRVRATTRNGNDLAPSFPELRALGAALGNHPAVLDGEIVVLDGTGAPSFRRLQQRLHVGTATAAAQRASAHPASFLAFDVLYLDGHSTMELDYEERRALLEKLDLNATEFATPPSLTSLSGPAALEIARERHLEGVVAKRRLSRYWPGARTGDWIKIKHARTQEVVIGGWTEGNGARAASFGALLLGIPEASGLCYIGKVGTGFDAASRADLLRRLAPLARRTSPFSSALPRVDAAVAHFVRPVCVGEVRFHEWTADSRLRQPSWRGLRLDKRASEVTREP